MTAYIERIVTEVVVQPEQSDTGEAIDTRWTERQNVQAHISAQERLMQRVKADGLDD